MVYFSIENWYTFRLTNTQDGANAEMSINCSCFNIVRMIKLLGGVCQFINELRKIKLKYA